MSVNSHLTSLASAAIIRDAEKASIATSISTLSTRINLYFGADVDRHFIFGSYTRNTILPRSMDERSDIDYMVVFSDSSRRPQTYLDRLRRFVSTRYARSEVAQSNPTVVLNLSHIKFELTPAIEAWYYGLQIPGPSSNYVDWIQTNPNDFNQALTNKNNSCGFQIKPMIRIIKFWNARSGYPFASYELEKHLVAQAYYGATNLRDYVFAGFRSLSIGYFEAQWKRDRLARALSVIDAAERYEVIGLPATAELEIKKILPTPY